MLLVALLHFMSQCAVTVLPKFAIFLSFCFLLFYFFVAVQHSYQGCLSASTNKSIKIASNKDIDQINKTTPLARELLR